MTYECCSIYCSQVWLSSGTVVPASSPYRVVPCVKWPLQMDFHHPITPHGKLILCSHGRPDQEARALR